jgi:hypothetical protein
MNNDIYALKTRDFKYLKRLKQGKGPYDPYLMRPGPGFEP